jgi:hypothetical protein
LFSADIVNAIPYGYQQYDNERFPHFQSLYSTGDLLIQTNIEREKLQQARKANALALAFWNITTYISLLAPKTSRTSITNDS